MILPDALSKSKNAELLEELALYRTFGEIVVAPEAELTNLEKRRAEVARLQAEAGFAYVVTQEDLDNNPVFVEEGATVGEVVILSFEETRKALAAIAPKTQPDGGDDIQDSPAGEDGAPVAEELVYKGRTVIAVRDRLTNGRSYKEVEISGETHLLTVDEFNAQVTPRA